MDKLNKKWLEHFEEKKRELAPICDLNTYFIEGNEIAEMKINLMPLGDIAIPTGEIMARDPLTYLSCQEDFVPYFRSVPTGTFPVTASVIEPEYDCARYAAVKIDFSDETPVRYEEALTGVEDLEHLVKGEYFGFNVDSGIACFIDKKVAEAYCKFQEDWSEAHSEDENIYDDYFMELFEESYKNNPKFQRSGGDWVNWHVPGTQYNFPMFQSGFGDGAYPVYFGFDKNGDICRIVVQFIAIELAFE